MLSNKRPENMERITTQALAEECIAQKIEEVRAQVGDKKVLLALSGGVDSSVVAALLIRAIGKQLVCVHVNHGLSVSSRKRRASWRELNSWRRAPSILIFSRAAV